uniref:Uncharacterized protein n=1 Tax=Meloidogyne javanica TaxID=6303 RepID=A0A915MFW1_MELJA
MCSEEKQQKNEWIDVMKSDKVQDFFLLKQIQWKFNTAYSPWRGAFYERLIGSIKHHLYRVIGKKMMQFEELYTLLIEVERILNERPLTYYTSRELVIPLRPIDILDCSVENPSGINLTSIIDEDPDYEPTKSNVTNLLRAHQLAMERWHQVKNKSIGFPYIDQIVLIKSENDQCPRNMAQNRQMRNRVPLEARSPFLIITDRRVEELREYLRNENIRCRVRRKIWMRISERIDYPGLGNIIRQVEPYYFADMIVMSEAARIPRILDQQERNRNRNLVNRRRNQFNYGAINNNSSRNRPNENNFRRNNFERNQYFHVRQNNYRRNRDTSRERIREENVEPRIKRARIIENNVRENRIIIPEIITNRGNNNLQNKRESNRLEIKDVGILQINKNKQEQTKEIDEEKLKQFQEIFEEMKKYINIANENKEETSTSNKTQEDKNVVKLGKQIEFNGGKENLEEIIRFPLREINEEVLNITAKLKPTEIKNTL